MNLLEFCNMYVTTRTTSEGWVLVSGVADGYLQWGDDELSMYHFKDCPVYAGMPRIVH